MNLGDVRTTDGVAEILQNEDDDAVDPHLERIKNEAGGDESDEEVNSLSVAWILFIYLQFEFYFGSCAICLWLKNILIAIFQYFPCNVGKQSSLYLYMSCGQMFPLVLVSSYRKEQILTVKLGLPVIAYVYMTSSHHRCQCLTFQLLHVPTGCLLVVVVNGESMQDEDFVIDKDDGGSPTDDSGDEESDASESGDEKEAIYFVPLRTLIL